MFIQAVLKRRFSDSLDFYVNQKNKQLIEVIIRSSNGSIHYQAHKNTNIRQVINHYQQFFEKIQNRNLLNNGLLEKVHFFQFIRGNTINKPRIKSIKVNSTDNYDGFRLVQAIATQKHVLSAGFDLYTSESCFLYVDHGEGVYAKLRDEILSFRENNEHYPIFLTDIDLSAINEKVSIVEALVYKKSIERKLNRLR